MNKLSSEQSIINECNYIPQLLSIKDVIHYTGPSRSSIYDMINENSDRYDPMFQKKA